MLTLTLRDLHLLHPLLGLPLKVCVLLGSDMWKVENWGIWSVIDDREYSQGNQYTLIHSMYTFSLPSFSYTNSEIGRKGENIAVRMILASFRGWASRQQWGFGWWYTLGLPDQGNVPIANWHFSEVCRTVSWIYRSAGELLVDGRFSCCPEFRQYPRILSSMTLIQTASPARAR